MNNKDEKCCELGHFYCRGALFYIQDSRFNIHDTIFSPAFFNKLDIESSMQDSLSLPHYLLEYRDGFDRSSLLADTDGNSFFESHSCWNIAGIIGVEFLKKFHVIFDYPHDKLYLKLNRNECLNKQTIEF